MSKLLPEHKFCLALITQDGTPQIVVNKHTNKPRIWETHGDASGYLWEIDPNGYKEAIVLRMIQAYKSGWVQT